MDIEKLNPLAEGSPLDGVLGAHKSLVGEVTGTFILTMTAAMAGGSSLAIAGILFALAACGSGSYNPAHVIADMINKKTNPQDGALTIVAQIAGAFLGALCADGTMADGIGEYTIGDSSVLNALIAQALFYMYYSNTRNGEESQYSALATALSYMVAVTATGSLLNPAYGTAVPVVNGNVDDLYVFWLGPIIGCLANKALDMIPENPITGDFNEMKGTFFFGASLAMGAPTELGLAAAVFVALNNGDSQYNPAITVNSFLNGDSDIVSTLRTTVAQVAGALVAAFYVKEATDASFNGLNGDGVDGNGHTLLMEMLFTFIWCSIHASDSDSKSLSTGLAVMAGAAAGAAAMNPVFATGFGIVNDSASDCWLYWVGPIMGGLLHTVYTRMTGSDAKGEEVEEDEAEAEPVV